MKVFECYYIHISFLLTLLHSVNQPISQKKDKNSFYKYFISGRKEGFVFLHHIMPIFKNLLLGLRWSSQHLFITGLLLNASKQTIKSVQGKYFKQIIQKYWKRVGSGEQEYNRHKNELNRWNNEYNGGKHINKL